MLQRLAQAFEQKRAVWQAGELVVIGAGGEDLGGFDPIADVACVEDQPVHRGVVDEVGGHDLEVAPRTVRVEHAQLDRAAHRGRVREFGGGDLDAFEVVGMGERENVAPFEIAGGVPQHPHDRRAGVHDAATRANDAHEVAGVFDERGEADLAGAHALLGVAQVAEIAGHQRYGFDEAVLAMVCDEQRRNGDLVTESVGERELALPRPGAGEGGERGRGVLRLRPLVEHGEHRGFVDFVRQQELAERVVRPRQVVATRVEDRDEVGRGLEDAGELLGAVVGFDVLGDVAEREHHRCARRGIARDAVGVGGRQRRGDHIDPAHLAFDGEQP
ncbi:unannotated protein [freshwater metagenome]|uniref:Unannotated protein n=1 Tax=freshwater metagenome TaxID=449393 RepID=A0A6J7J106_9ZZZZ